MRNRETITKETQYTPELRSLEVLLDIRDLLTSPQVNGKLYIPLPQTESPQGEHDREVCANMIWRGEHTCKGEIGFEGSDTKMECPCKCHKAPPREAGCGSVVA
jgi:hypothetical protein